ncbi:MAG: hypothetical protein DRP85_04670 [Candidatus Makaraimicrobium thalassicum]|nr:MAG: hypothetical protein DRP85_04670 [Candidatus Omnitrophota bacterium]
MADNNFQDDFFGNHGFRRKSSEKLRLLSRYSEQRFLPFVKIPVEYSVIIAIAVLFLIIVSYAVGVERGKRLSGVESGSLREETVQPHEAINRSREPADFPEPERRRQAGDIVQLPLESHGVGSKASYPEIGDDESAKRHEGKISAESSYILQLASFKDETSAEKEINRLKRKGIEACLAKKGIWWEVYTSGYRTISEARRARRGLLTDYEDCYIKQIR